MFEPKHRIERYFFPSKNITKELASIHRTRSFSWKLTIGEQHGQIRRLTSHLWHLARSIRSVWYHQRFGLASVTSPTRFHDHLRTCAQPLHLNAPPPTGAARRFTVVARFSPRRRGMHAPIPNEQRANSPPNVHFLLPHCPFLPSLLHALLFTFHPPHPRFVTAILAQLLHLVRALLLLGRRAARRISGHQSRNPCEERATPRGGIPLPETRRRDALHSLDDPPFHPPNVHRSYLPHGRAPPRRRLLASRVSRLASSFPCTVVPSFGQEIRQERLWHENKAVFQRRNPVVVRDLIGSREPGKYTRCWYIYIYSWDIFGRWI